MREPVEAAVDGEGEHRVIARLSRLDVFAPGKLDEETAARFAAACRRGDAEVADAAIRGPAAHCHRLAPAFHPAREDDARTGSHAPVAVDLEGEIPALSPELEAVAADHANRRARARLGERPIPAAAGPEKPEDRP